MRPAFALPAATAQHAGLGSGAVSVPLPSPAARSQQRPAQHLRSSWIPGSGARIPRPARHEQQERTFIAARAEREPARAPRVRQAGDVDLVATVGQGLEAVVARELREGALGYADSVTVSNGRCVLTVPEKEVPEAAARSAVWLRSAHRLYVRLGSFPAETFDDLFDGVHALEWERYLPKDAEVPVDFKTFRSPLVSVPNAQAIIKKAIVSRMQKAYPTLRGGDLPEDGPLCSVLVAAKDDMVEVLLDVGGRHGLHKRGYRKLVGEAPIKETLASAILALSVWRPERPLVDPFCGSGTILLEAALMGWKIAPGLRRRFAAEGWLGFDGAFKRAREEGREAADLSAPLRMLGTDIDPEAIDIAREHLSVLGFPRRRVERLIEFERCGVEAMHAGRHPLLREQYGVIITNPPYGERIGELREAQAAFGDLRRLYSKLPTWSASVIVARSAEFQKHFRKPADRIRKVYNGRIECGLYQYLGPRPPRPEQALSAAEGEGEAAEPTADAEAPPAAAAAAAE
eukprot:tig00000157_g9620.t1